MTQIIVSSIISLSASIHEMSYLIIIHRILKTLPQIIVYFNRHKLHKPSLHQFIYSCFIQEILIPLFAHRSEDIMYPSLFGIELFLIIP